MILPLRAGGRCGSPVPVYGIGGEEVNRERSPQLALFVLCIGFFVILLDTTIVNVALPTMLDSLHASLDGILWVVNAYLLSFAVLLVTGGRLGDILGPRRLFIGGLAAFSLASACCGLAQDASQLIAARVAQGIAAAVLTPQTLTIISAIFPAERRGAALGTLSASAAMAAVLGPVLGGVIVTDLDWRWIFFVNVPIGVAGIVLAFLFVPALRPGTRHGLDLVGVVLVSAGLFGVVFGLIEGQRYDWAAIGSSPVTIPEVMAAGVALIAAFLVWERFQAEPLLPLRLFRNRTFSVMVWLMAVLWFALLGFMTTSIIYLQSVLGMSAIQAGLTVTPITLTMIVVAPLAGRLTDRIGGRSIFLLGFLVDAAGMAAAAAVESIHSTSWTFTAPLVAIGFGMACVIAPVTTEALREVPQALAGAASGLLNTSRQLGSAAGIAVLGAVLQNQLVGAMRQRAAVDAVQLPPPLRPAFIDGFARAGTSGLEVGRGQAGGVQVPAGLPPQAADLVRSLIHDVFANGYVDALRPTLGVAVAALLLGAASCVLIARSVRVSTRADDLRVVAAPEDSTA
jgi:EmrB/QacA subfamily drug resistance transporter